MSRKFPYHNLIIDTATGVGKQATITVLNVGTVDKADIFSDKNGTPKPNPFVTDSVGRFTFFADPGEYDIEVSGENIVPYKIEPVLITGLSSPPSGMNMIVNSYIDPNESEVVYEII